MAVQQNPIEITPYTSSVPLIQMPPQEMDAGDRPAAPLPGQFGKKGTGALAIGDSLLKGFMQGHQQKEQRKQAEAQTTIAAADAATSKAWEDYQNALTSAQGNVNDPKAQGAYETYTGIFNAGKQAKAKFVIPEKSQKGDKAQKKGVKGEVKAGFNNIKDFFEANPHIVPQIALLTMQPNKPGLTPQGQVQNLELQRAQKEEQQADITLSSAQRVQAAQKTYDMYSGLSDTEMAALPREEQQKFQVAKNVIFQQHGVSGLKEYVSADGQNRDYFYPGQQPQGWQAAAGAAGAQPKIGTEGEFTAQAYKKYGVTAQTASPELSKYIHDWWQWKQAQQTSTTSGSTTDIHGNRTSTNSSTRQTPAPKPPAGFKPVEEEAPQGGITPPPQQAAPTATKGKIAKPPTTAKTATGKIAAPPTLTDSNRTQKVETEKSTRYATAYGILEQAKQKNLATYNMAIKNGVDPGTAQKALDAANQEAQSAYDSKGAEIQKWYADQVRSAGGRMPTDLPEEAQKQLKAGFVTTFGNGQQWTLDANGQPKLISQGK